MSRLSRVARPGTAHRTATRTVRAPIDTADHALAAWLARDDAPPPSAAEPAAEARDEPPYDAEGELAAAAKRAAAARSAASELRVARADDAAADAALGGERDAGDADVDEANVDEADVDEARRVQQQRWQLYERRVAAIAAKQRELRALQAELDALLDAQRALAPLLFPDETW